MIKMAMFMQPLLYFCIYKVKPNNNDSNMYSGEIVSLALFGINVQDLFTFHMFAHCSIGTLVGAAVRGQI